MGYDYYIANLSLRFVTSRTFVFEQYFAGKIVVQRKFTPDEIREEGGVSNALATFNDNMAYALDGSGFDIWAVPITRRSRNNKYVFEVSAERHNCFNESQVVGDLALIDRDMNIDEVRMISIDNLDDELEARTAELKSELESVLEEGLPANVKLVTVSIDFIDQDDDVYYVTDEMMTNSGVSSR